MNLNYKKKKQVISLIKVEKKDEIFLYLVPEDLSPFLSKGNNFANVFSLLYKNNCEL